MEEKKVRVLIDKKMFSNFWNTAVQDSQINRETGALLNGGFNGNYVVNGLYKTFRGMSEEEIRKKFTPLEKELEEYGMKFKVKGAVNVEPAYVSDYRPNGPIVGDMHTHPVQLSAPEFSVVDIETRENICELLRKSKKLKEYDYLSVLTHCPSPDTKLIWDTLFNEMGRNKGKSSRELKKELLECWDDTTGDIYRESLSENEARILKPVINVAGKMVSYHSFFNKLSEPYLRPPSSDNYREVLDAARKIYFVVMDRGSDFPKNKLIEQMQRRDFLLQLNLHGILEDYVNFGISVRPMIFHASDNGVSEKKAIAESRGKVEWPAELNDFLAHYNKKFGEKYDGGSYGIMNECIRLLENKELQEAALRATLLESFHL
jgi:hypothetical protein